MFAWRERKKVTRASRGVEEKQGNAAGAERGEIGPADSEHARSEGGKRPERRTMVDEASVDLYAVLGVSRQSKDIEIRRAYRNLITREHPDKGGDAQR